MGSWFINYFKDLVSESNLRRICEGREASANGICRLRSSLKNREAVWEWAYEGEIKARGKKPIAGLYSFSRGICLSIEEWLSLLPVPKTTEGISTFQGCQYDKYVEAKSQSSPDQQCRVKGEQLIWNTLKGVNTMDMWQESQRSLQACMDIVRIIMVILGIKMSGQTVNSKDTRDKHICQEIYEELCHWGGKKIAREIMMNWFQIEDESGKVISAWQLPGADLYEVITHEIAGLGKGDKGTVCRVKISGDSTHGQPPEQYETHGSEWDNLKQEREEEVKQLWQGRLEHEEKGKQRS
ncbi:hypothetical protein C922_05070 [Plasmodium inui San Antonio 1]|uniref:Uncharacterized protein n=1 Tax=Plasmodium inui San Antonio 1 TaxID=1237626 RepID=W7A662_9APIC|nr:hypothetical protein C922_05070 [Plasmodium inui San Antonio 1]EUD64554.1 hypothetical protein C922_05070 [Plasmodium inui San Antonio 1]